MKTMLLGAVSAASLMLGCASSADSGTNAFLSLAQLLGRTTSGSNGGSSGGGTATPGFFRESSRIQFQNNNTVFEVNFSFVAWVNVSSIRSADQQDALFSNGYVQLTSSVQIGTAVSLPPGTFVFNGPGKAGATLLRIPPGECREIRSTGAMECGSTSGASLISPDGILVFADPPVSCDSAAFEFTEDGFPVTDIRFLAVASEITGVLFEGATGTGPIKTLQQVQGYQCNPFMPGYFLRDTQGATTAADAQNLYLEGDSITFSFDIVPEMTTGFYATVTIAP